MPEDNPRDGRDIILLHGWGGSYERTWVRLGWAEQLRARGFDVTGLNLLGHGVAKAEHDPLAYEDMVGPVFQKLRHRRGAIGIGYSLGAKILLTLSARNPGMFAGLVLVGIGDNAFRPLGASNALASALLDGVPAGAPAPFVRMIEEVRASGNDVRAMAACITRPQESPLTPAELDRVSHPVAVINGSEDKFVLPQDKLLASLRNAKSYFYDGMDHLDIIEGQSIIGCAIDFIENIEQKCA